MPKPTKAKSDKGVVQLPPSLAKLTLTEYQRDWRRKKREDPEFRLKAAEIQRRYYANDPNKSEKAFIYRLKTRYGLTKKQYDELFAKQEGRCFLCGKHQSELKTRLAVDHDHQSFEVRSLLCGYCNLRVVGRLRIDTVQKVYEYLNREYTGIFVSKKKKWRKRKKSKRRRTSG